MINTQYATITECDDSLAARIQSADVSEDVRRNLQAANVLLVPNEGYLEHNQPLFPKGTEQFFQFLRNAQADGVSVDICIDDEAYKELGLHTDLMILSEIVTTILAAPLLVNLTTEFIKNRLGSRRDKTNIKLKMTICDEQSKKGMRVDYDGPATEYEFTMNSVLKTMQVDNTKYHSNPALTNLRKDDHD